MLYYYDIVYRLDGKFRWMYVVSCFEYKDGIPPFVSEKQYPKTWRDVHSYLANEERVKFIKWREERMKR